jgi:transposase
MMRVLDPAIYDTLYRLVVERIPSPPAHRYGGCRPRISDEICFRGLFWRFVTGAAWETVEVMIDRQVSDTTLRSRRDEWVAAGVFDDLMEHALGEYDRLVGIDTNHVAIDGSSQLAPGGGECTGCYPGSKGRLGFKWSCGVDATGIGLGFVIDTGGRNDFRLLRPTLDTITSRVSTTRIGTLHLDRGYGYKCLSDRLEGYDIGQVEVIERNQPGDGRVQLVGFQRRWVVERTNAWLTNFRQLKLNWDRRVAHRHAAVCLAFAIITIYKLIDHLNNNDLPLETIR